MELHLKQVNSYWAVTAEKDGVERLHFISPLGRPAAQRIYRALLDDLNRFGDDCILFSDLPVVYHRARFGVLFHFVNEPIRIWDES